MVCVEEVLTSSQLKLNKDGITLPLFQDGRWVKLIHAEAASKNRLQGLTFVQRSRNGTVEVIRARDAAYRDAQWQLEDVRIFASLAEQNRFVVNRIGNLQKARLLSVDAESLSGVRLGFHHSKLGFLALQEHITDELRKGKGRRAQALHQALGNAWGNR